MHNYRVVYMTVCSILWATVASAGVYVGDLYSMVSWLSFDVLTLIYTSHACMGAYYYNIGLTQPVSYKNYITCKFNN